MALTSCRWMRLAYPSPRATAILRPGRHRDLSCPLRQCTSRPLQEVPDTTGVCQAEEESPGEILLLEQVAKRCSLALPAQRLQAALPVAERKQLKAASEALARSKRLMKISIGQQGITFNFLMACMDLLVKHEIIRVKIGSGAGYSRDDMQFVLQELLDCVCVHKIGFTLTLYRNKTLPRPAAYAQQPLDS